MSFTRKVDHGLALLLYQPHHAEELYAVVDASRDHLGRWLPWPAKVQSVDDQRRWIETNLRTFADTGRAALGILEHDRIVGGIDNAMAVRYRGNMEIGYWLAAGAEGRGMVTRACRAMVNDAFAQDVVHRIEIRAEPTNTRSCAVPERLGFICEGTIRHVCRFNDRWVDHRLYAMLKEDWEQQDDPE